MSQIRAGRWLAPAFRLAFRPVSLSLALERAFGSVSEWSARSETTNQMNLTNICLSLLVVFFSSTTTMVQVLGEYGGCLHELAVIMRGPLTRASCVVMGNTQLRVPRQSGNKKHQLSLSRQYVSSRAVGGNGKRRHFRPSFSSDGDPRRSQHLP